MITQFFEPEPLCRGLVFARGLVSIGHSVTVITGYPHYPGGVLYPPYRQRMFFSENIEGIRIIRVPLYISHDTNALRRIANYTSFMVSSFVHGLFRFPKFDVAYVYHPPLTTCFSAMALCAVRRKPFVCDIQDIWPDSVAASGMLNNVRALGWLEKMCSLVYRRADRVVVISEGAKTLLQARGVPAEKLALIGNWCDEDALRHPAANELPPEHAAIFEGRFSVVYAGNIGEVQALDAVVDAAILTASVDPSIQFVFIGSGTRSDALSKRCAEQLIENVVFLPRVPMDEIGAYLNLADALLVHLADLPLFSMTVPSKTQSSMAIGKPLLMAVRGDASAIVRDNRCGVIAQPGDPRSISSAALELASSGKSELREMGLRAKEAYERLFSRKVGVQKFADLFERMVRERAQK